MDYLELMNRRNNICWQCRMPIEGLVEGAPLHIAEGRGLIKRWGAAVLHPGKCYQKYSSAREARKLSSVDPRNLRNAEFPTYLL